MIELRRLAAVVVLIGLTTASASSDDGPAGDRHLRLLKSEPAEGAVLDTPPANVQLWFSEPPEARVTTIRLVLPGGEARRLQNITVDAEDDSHIIAAADTTLGPGAYRITWRTMSGDGHVVNGEVGYEVAGK